VVALAHLVEVLRSEPCALVIDLPARHPLRETLVPDADVLLLPPTLAGLVAADLSLRAETMLVVVDIGRADVKINAVGEYLPLSPVGTVHWQRSVTTGGIAGGALPRSSDVMRVAELILGALGGRGTD
jgi:hypothetical protein